jgi:hypothetical protein
MVENSKSLKKKKVLWGLLFIVDTRGALEEWEKKRNRRFILRSRVAFRQKPSPCLSALTVLKCMNKGIVIFVFFWYSSADACLKCCCSVPRLTGTDDHYATLQHMKTTRLT